MKDSELSQEERTGGRDAQLSAGAMEGHTLVAMDAVRQMDVVLKRVRQARIAKDVDEGFFRDWPDWAPRVVGYPVPRSWSDLLTVETLRVDKLAVKRMEPELREQLVRLAEVTVAWIEALDRRADGDRFRVKRLSLWGRLKFRLTGRLP